MAISRCRATGPANGRSSIRRRAIWPRVGIGTPADPTNPLSVYATSALFNSGGDIASSSTKPAATNTASFLYPGRIFGPRRDRAHRRRQFPFQGLCRRVDLARRDRHQFLERHRVVSERRRPEPIHVAGLPAPSSALIGAIAIATNGRKSGEGAGAGTGCPAWCDGSHWRTFYDNSIVAA